MKIGFMRKLWLSFAAEGDDAGGAGGGTPSAGEIEVGGDEGTSGAVIDIPTGASGSEEFLKTIPKDYHDKPYMKGINSLDDLMKQFDNAQTLIGKKTVNVPDRDASDEDWKLYHEAIRPSSSDEYEFEDIKLSDDKKPIQDFINNIKDEKFEKGIRDIFHEVGLTKAQAAKLYGRVNSHFIESNEAIYNEILEHEKVLNRDFQAEAGKMFGDKVDSVLDSAKAVIDKYLPKELHGIFDGADNKALLGVATILHKYNKDHGIEDTPPGAGDSKPVSADEIREEGRKLMAHEAYNDVMHPRHEELKRRVNENYDRLKGLGKKK